VSRDALSEGWTVMVIVALTVLVMVCLPVLHPGVTAEVAD
jgi:hypothetical protein